MQEFRKKNIRMKADFIRQRCTVGRYGIVDLFKECDRLGYKLIRYPLGEQATLGFTLLKEKDIIIFTNTSIRLSREIFTLAHEIGHAVLHMDESGSFMDDSLTLSEKSMDENEQEANYFAACLLMPADDVKKFLDFEIDDFLPRTLSAMDIAKLMSEFNVSFDMVLNRLENLQIIDSSVHLRLDSEKNQKRVKNLLKSVGGNAKLNETSESVAIPYEYIEYVIYNYNHNVIPKETLEKALAYCQLSIEDISDKLIVRPEEKDDLDELIGGLTD